jgi:hypothetical protein
MREKFGRRPAGREVLSHRLGLGRGVQRRIQSPEEIS